MRCPHCEEDDIDCEVEIEPTVTDKEKTRIKDLEDELHDSIALIGEQGADMYRLKLTIAELEYKDE